MGGSQYIVIYSFYLVIYFKRDFENKTMLYLPTYLPFLVLFIFLSRSTYPHSIIFFYLKLPFDSVFPLTSCLKLQIHRWWILSAFMGLRKLFFKVFFEVKFIYNIKLLTSLKCMALSIVTIFCNRHLWFQDISSTFSPTLQLYHLLFLDHMLVWSLMKWGGKQSHYSWTIAVTLPMAIICYSWDLIFIKLHCSWGYSVGKQIT